MDLAQAASVGEERFETVWSAVYNLSTREVQVALGRAYNRVHTFRLERAARTTFNAETQRGRRRRETLGRERLSTQRRKEARGAERRWG